MSTGQMLNSQEPRADELFEALAVDLNGELLAVAVDSSKPVIRLWNFTDKQVVTGASHENGWHQWILAKCDHRKVTYGTITDLLVDAV